MSADADAVFAALSDATRRRIVEALASGDATTPTALAAQLPITRQAVAKHLAVLAEAQLVAGRREGRETRYRLTPEPLQAAAEWIAAVGADWDERLAALARLFDGGPATGAAARRDVAGR